jgi:hypothetical protein
MRLVLAIALAFAAREAHAQPQPSSTANAEADALFDQGRALMDAGKLAEACRAFDASQRLSPAVSTLFNQANCRELNHQLATAYGLFREADRQTRAPLDDGTQKLNRVATARARALEPRLSKLTIEAATVPGLEVRRNDAVVDPATWGRALPLDGGTYKLTATAPDHEPWSGTIVVETEGDAKTVKIPRLVARPRAERPASATASASAPHSKLVPYALAGGAAVLLAGALGSELLARRDYTAAKTEPDDFRQEDLWGGAKTKRYLAQGFAVAGVAAASAAVWIYLRDRRAERIQVAPAIAAGRAGLQLEGSF